MITELARAEGPESIRKLAYLRDHAKSEALQGWPADRLLDRSFGKPPQAVAVADVSRAPNINPSKALSLTELQQAYAGNLKVVSKDTDYSFDLDPSEYRRQPPQLTHGDQAAAIKRAINGSGGQPRIRRDKPQRRIRRRYWSLKLNFALETVFLWLFKAWKAAFD